MAIIVTVRRSTFFTDGFSPRIGPSKIIVILIQDLFETQERCILMWCFSFHAKGLNNTEITHKCHLFSYLGFSTSKPSICLDEHPWKVIELVVSPYPLAEHLRIINTPVELFKWPKYAFGSNCPNHIRSDFFRDLIVFSAYTPFGQRSVSHASKITSLSTRQVQHHKTYSQANHPSCNVLNLQLHSCCGMRWQVSFLPLVVYSLSRYQISQFYFSSDKQEVMSNCRYCIPWRVPPPPPFNIRQDDRPPSDCGLEYLWCF